jgi:hypothetical protein
MVCISGAIYASHLRVFILQPFIQGIIIVPNIGMSWLIISSMSTRASSTSSVEASEATSRYASCDRPRGNWT